MEKLFDKLNHEANLIAIDNGNLRSKLGLIPNRSIGWKANRIIESKLRIKKYIAELFQDWKTGGIKQ